MGANRLQEDLRRGIDLDAVLDHVGDAELVLIGEASHGTDEFYRVRADITKRLVSERGFKAVAVEADWPDAERVNRFVTHPGDDSNGNEALSGFRRFPTWMWRNDVVLEFVEWLREHNAAQGEAPVGFFGLDLYSLNASREAVIRYLERVDREAAERARRRYSCFDPYREDLQDYGLTTLYGEPEPCRDEVVAQLGDLRQRGIEYASRDGRVAQEEFFFAERNAALVRDAEAYYRAMYAGGAESWNLRDRHMAETLESLRRYLERLGREPKVVVWAHNSHLGDARATEMGAAGELNLGQLAREAYGRRVRNVGFTTNAGTVTAASRWGGAAERKRVRPALRGSFEALFHETGVPEFVLLPGSDHALADGLGRRLERAIGVIYRPETERASHYFHARLADQFDVVIHVDETRALRPLEPMSEWDPGEPPETYPWAV
ncbi:MAG TPA: erythromycin esterase family protein [Actinomycetota bacterium]|nr:erythromycin esterase family protein [Actinomycetota bacterium]